MTTFTFRPLERTVWDDADTKELFTKWGLSTLRVFGFSFDQSFSLANPHSFLSDLFSDENVRKAVMISDRRGNLTPLSEVLPPGPALVSPDNVARLDVTVTTMNYFDCLSADGDQDSAVISTRAGHPAIKMPDVFLPRGTSASDRLRELFMRGEESEYFHIMPPRAFSELITRIMQVVVAGGALCQYEDNFDVYSDAVKQLYKQVVSVQKVDGVVTPSTHAFEVYAIGGSGGSTASTKLFPFPEMRAHNACIVTVTAKREVFVIYTAFADM